MAEKIKTNRIGLILPTSSNHATQTLIDHARTYLSHRGYDLLIGLTSHDITREASYLEYFSKETDGIIIFSVAQEYFEIENLIPKDFPIVFLYRKPRCCPFTTIYENNFSAIQQIFVSQMNEEHDKIGCILGRADFIVSEEALKALHATTGVSTQELSDSIINLTHATPETVAESIETLKQRGCTSIFTGTQHLTMLALNHLLVHNPLGDDGIELAGISDPLFENALFRSIDSVQQPTVELAKLALQQVLVLMDHPADYHDFVLKSQVCMKTLGRFHSVTTSVS